MAKIFKKCFCISIKNVIDTQEFSFKTNSVFDDYDAIKIVGRGTYSQVWLCNDKKTRNLVAIKFSIKVPNSNVYLFRECKLIHSFDCDCIIKPICFYENEKYSQMVLPYYKQDLLQYLETHLKIVDLDFKKIMKRMAKAMQYVHSKNIVHRDIKPENIMFNKSFDDCVLIDWGFSEHEDDINVGKIVGTPRYIAPEVLFAATKPNAFVLTVGKASDMYSLGMTMYLMAAKKNTIEINGYNDIRNFPPNYMTDDINNLNREEGFKDILHRLLCPNPISRMTADELVNHPYLL